MRVLLTAAIASWLVAAGACGEPRGSTPTPGFAEVAAALAAEVPVGAGDLPEEWRPAADADLIARIELPAECDVRDLDVLFPGAVAGESSEPLSGEGGSFVVSYGAVYQSEGDAIATVRGMDGLAARCQEDFKKAAEDLVRNEMEAIGIDLGIFADVDSTFSGTTAADEQHATRTYRMAVSVGLPGIAERFTLDVFVVRSGAVVGTAMYAVIGDPDPNDQGVLISALSDNARDVAGRLPAQP